MYPSGMTRVVNGTRYSVDKSTLIASNHYWDGSNFERSGRNTWLFRTANGNYFFAHMTQWQGEKDTLIPCSEVEARDAYEDYLLEHNVSYEAAFPGVTVKEA